MKEKRKFRAAIAKKVARRDKKRRRRTGKEKEQECKQIPTEMTFLY